MIEFKDVSKVYPNGVVGLDNVNLKIEQGEFVAIIGLSGAGKSTLLRTINRMHDITSGTLTVDGLEVKNLKGKELRTFRRKIGMIFQSFNLVTRTTVIRNVLMAKVPEMLDCQHFFRQIFLGYFSDIVQAFDTLRKNVCGDDYTSLHNPIVLSSVLPAYGMFHSIQILFL